MAGFSIIMVMLPIIATFFWLFLTIIGGVGICLIVGGVCGIILNKLYIKETGQQNSQMAKGRSILTVITGVVVFLFPIVVTILLGASIFTAFLK